MEQMRMKHNETGRSMVEMLGVLAVVGVLSIGGVAGYRYAVDKMNANEIINELKKRAITASQQRVLGQGINLAEYGAILGKYEVTPANGYPEDPAFFGLEIKAVPQKVCQHIVDSDWAMPAEMKIGNLIMEKGTTCPDEFNDMTFAFNNTLESGDAGNGGNTGTSGRPPVDPNNECAKNDATPLRAANGSCYSCDENRDIGISNSGDCSVCDGTRGAKRYVTITRAAGKYCVLENDCPEGSIPDDQTGYCECPAGQIITWNEGRCMPCSEAAQTADNHGFLDFFVVSVLEDNADTTCAVCGWEATNGDIVYGNASLGVSQCIVSGKPEISESISNPEVSVSLEVSDDQMSCESLKGFGRDEGGSGVCASCGDIRTLDKNGSCWLTTCPDGYMHDFAFFGTCIPCSQMDNATNSDFEDGGTMTQMFISECQACGGTFQSDDDSPRGGYCHSNSVL